MNNKSLVQKLERKFGRYAIKNLIIYILLAYVVGYVLIITDSRLHIYDYITMNPEMVMHGQVWRLFTWVCTVPQTLGFFVVFMFIFYYFIGKSLEATLGAFKYNLYMFSGWFFMTLGAMLVYLITYAIYGQGLNLDVSTYYLNLASFLAFALLYPNQQVYFFFLIPIKMKWLAIFDIAYLVYRIITYIIALSNTGGIDYAQFGITESYYRAALYAQIFSIIISLLNFVIFYLAIRKVTPKNIRQNIKNAHDQRKRQEEWRKNWESSKKNWQDAGWQDGQTKWNEKDDQRNDDADYDKWGRNPDNKEFFDWADIYDPDMDEQTRKENVDEYRSQRQKNLEAEKKETRAERKRREKNSMYGKQDFEHKCEVCGRTNISDPELGFRFCSKCDGNHEYCQDHIFDHEHR